MADLRCPMCGKLNPDILDTCQFCQARLKPKEGIPDGAPDGTGAAFSPEVPGSELPDWLQSLRGKIADTSDEEDGETPPWLKRIRERKGEESQPQSPPEINLPGWKIEENPELPSSESPAAERPTEESDWLDELRVQPELVPPAFSLTRDEGILSSGVPEGEEDEPDWLKKLRAHKVTPDPGAAVENTPEEPFVTAEIPPESGTVAGTAESPTSEEANFPTEETPVESETLPFSIEEPAQPAHGLSQPEAEPAGEHLPGFSEVEAGSEILPAYIEEGGFDELASEQVQESASEELLPLPPVVPETPTDIGQVETPPQEEGSLPLPDWLKDFQAQAPSIDKPPAPIFMSAPSAPVEEASSEPFISADLPDWLGKLSPAVGAKAPPPKAEPPTGQDGEDLVAQSELPSWIHAMRPIESIAPSAPVLPESEQRIEDRGPLAGLRGILPSELGAIEFHKSSVISQVVEATEKQRHHQALLESLLVVEPEAQKPQAAAAGQQTWIWRAVIALVLLAAVIYPIVTGAQIAPLPNVYPPEVQTVQQTIDALAPGAPVLLAIDYEPGLSGEMQAISADVVDQLMAKGARLTLISTSPAGQALASQLVNTVLENPSPYQQLYTNNNLVANLGYLAGGTVGLLSFAASPSTTMPYTVDGQLAWGSTVLQNVATLSDFKLAVLFTENADTGRAWVEQVEPALGSTPFLLVSSAQAAPMLRPYLESGQFEGMVSGLSGGAILEALNSHPGQAGKYWSAYQAGLWAAIAMIVIGALVQGAILFINNRKAQKGGA